MSLEDFNIRTLTHRFIFIAFENDVGCPVEFVQNVRPAKYRLFQLADLVCTLHLMELKIKNGIPLTCSENRFFGGPRDFQRNILKRIKRKEI